MRSASFRCGRRVKGSVVDIREAVEFSEASRGVVQHHVFVLLTTKTTAIRKSWICVMKSTPI
mgnify:CR=1 FL=1